jgi:hypothetical protein
MPLATTSWAVNVPNEPRQNGQLAVKRELPIKNSRKPTQGLRPNDAQKPCHDRNHDRDAGDLSVRLCDQLDEILSGPDVLSTGDAD